MSEVLVEACVDSPAAAAAAVRAGARRVELCAGLREGGTTPSVGALEACRASVAVPVFVMVRPRAGDFCYDDDEVGVMVRDVRVLRDHGAQGIVVGALTPAGEVDLGVLRRVLEEARPLPVTFHRGFDLSRDPEAALDALLGCGVERLLTSGGAATASDGAETLARLVRAAGSRLTVMAGGGVRAWNAADIVRRTGVRELHTGALRRVDGPMRHRAAAARVEKGGGDPFAREVPDEAEIRGIVTAVVL